MPYDAHDRIEPNRQSQPRSPLKVQPCDELIKGTDENIIAIIGDGSLSGGEAFEGLDEASELGTGIIIVVNDNEMCIS